MKQESSIQSIRNTRGVSQAALLGLAAFAERSFILPAFNLTDEAQPILSTPASVDDDYSNRHS